MRSSRVLLTPSKSEAQETPSSSSSNRNSSSHKPVTMARHHMIMFNKQECKDCLKLKETMAAEREDLLQRCSLEMAAGLEKHRLELQQRDSDLQQLRTVVGTLREELQGAGQKSGAAPQEGSGAAPQVGITERDHSLESLDTSFVKRSFSRTRTMRKTVSVEKYSSSQPTPSEVQQNLRRKIGTVRQELQSLRENDGPRRQIEQLEQIDRKLTRLGLQYGVVSERISERSEESQDTETEVTEVRFESPAKAADSIRLVQTRTARGNRFDFKKKNTSSS